MQIPSSSSNVKDGIAYWEKTAADVNDVDEKFSNARDLGYLRLNYARVTSIAQLSEYDKEDNYKIQVQSNGKFSLALRNTEGTDDKVLDLSKYDEALDELKKQFDPEGYAKRAGRKEKSRRRFAGNHGPRHAGAGLYGEKRQRSFGCRQHG